MRITVHALSNLNLILQDQELLARADEAFNETFDIIYSEDGWKEEKKNPNGDIVMSKKSKEGRYQVTRKQGQF